MGNLFRAIAVDYEGTLTRNDRALPAVLEALRAARTQGLMLVLRFAA
jgi:hydroxymethylpyrimidine pyrophosphatase-like HAD family hydrolase